MPRCLKVLKPKLPREHPPSDPLAVNLRVITTSPFLIPHPLQTFTLSVLSHLSYVIQYVENIR